MSGIETMGKEVVGKIADQINRLTDACRGGADSEGGGCQAWKRSRSSFIQVSPSLVSNVFSLDPWSWADT